MTDQAREIREFWFGRLPLSARALGERMRFWFPDDAAPELTRQRDAAIQGRFEPLEKGHPVPKAVGGPAEVQLLELD